MGVHNFESVPKKHSSESSLIVEGAIPRRLRTLSIGSIERRKAGAQRSSYRLMPVTSSHINEITRLEHESFNDWTEMLNEAEAEFSHNTRRPTAHAILRDFLFPPDSRNLKKLGLETPYLCVS